MNYSYDGKFFEYLQASSLQSARAITQILYKHLQPASVLDLGCGCGAWLTAFQEQGVKDYLGVEGNYARKHRFLIPLEKVRFLDVGKPLELGRKFSLAVSLEVGEHLVPKASKLLVENLVNHADIVYFSSAVVGQGGENHVNERPLEAWRSDFSEHGYICFDAIRPLIEKIHSIEPWYRYNGLIYARNDIVDDLPAIIRENRVLSDQLLVEGGSPTWMLRRAILGTLPRTWVSALSKARYRMKLSLDRQRYCANSGN